MANNKKTVDSESKLVQYAVWEIEKNDDESYGYWLLFDTIEDAISGRDEPVEVFKLKAKRLGKYRSKSVLVKVKQRKSRKAK